MAQQRTEEFKISGEDIMAKLKKLVNEGNVRKIMVKDKKGKTIAEFPTYRWSGWRSVGTRFGCCRRDCSLG